MTHKTFSPLYIEHVVNRSPSWVARSQFCIFLLCGRDCLFPLLPATHADHITYRNLGYELPMRDIVPLNRNTHQFITWLRALLKGWFGRQGQSVLAWIMRSSYAFWLSIKVAIVLWIWQNYIYPIVQFIGVGS